VLPCFFAALPYILNSKRFFFSLSSYFSEHTFNIQTLFLASGCTSPKTQPSNHDNLGLTHSREGVDTNYGLDGRDSSVSIGKGKDWLDSWQKQETFLLMDYIFRDMTPWWLMTFIKRSLPRPPGCKQLFFLGWLLRFWIRRGQADQKRLLLFTSQHGVTVRNICFFINILWKFYYLNFSALRNFGVPHPLPPPKKSPEQREKEKLPTYISFSIWYDIY
jgi:hypothetical protein